MPSLAPPSMQSLASRLPADLSRALQGAFKAQDDYGQSLAQQLSGALVVGDTLQVFAPYTASSPLAVPTDILSPTLGGGWTSVTAPKYSKDPAGWVEVSGVATGGGLNTDIVSGLPSPDAVRYCAGVSNNAFAQLLVTAAGGLQIVTGSTTNVSLAITYRSATRAPYVPSCFPFDLSWSLPQSPTLVVAQCQDVTNAQSPSNLAMLLPDWVVVQRSTGSILRIRNIPGLLPSTNYAVTVVAF